MCQDQQRSLTILLLYMEKGSLSRK